MPMPPALIHYVWLSHAFARWLRPSTPTVRNLAATICHLFTGLTPNIQVQCLCMIATQFLTCRGQFYQVAFRAGVRSLCLCLVWWTPRIPSVTGVSAFYPHHHQGGCSAHLYTVDSFCHSLHSSLDPLTS